LQPEVPGWNVTIPLAGRGEEADLPEPPPEPPFRSPTPAAPTLSVVIPYYRGEHVIRAAVQSVLEQTVAPSEIVICDDGSPDDLKAALGPLLGEVKIVRKDNGGISSAMNAATVASSGDYLVQLDQDDAFLPRRLEAIAATLAARPDIDVVVTGAIVEHEGSQVTVLDPASRVRDGNQRAAILGDCTILWPAVRRSLLIELGGYDESFEVMQDWECFVRLVYAGALTAFVQEPLYRWRLTPGSRSSRDRLANIEAQIRMTSKVIAESSLSPDERAGADSLLAARRRWLVREEARHAVQAHAPDARRRSLKLVTGAGFDRASRAKAAVAVLAPGVAARFLAQRRARADPAIEALTQRGFSRPE
jgi:cellulose synthase/poly-beta-1,6-N-acetylglucosamine synthase-like glycosyltransferase